MPVENCAPETGNKAKAAPRIYPGSIRMVGAVLLSCLLVFYCLYSSGLALTLERPSVNVDWSKLPDKQPKRPKAKHAPNRLFGTVEFRSNIKGLPQWDRIVRLYAGRKNIDQDFSAAQMQGWNKLKADVANKDILAKLQGVNNYFNRWPYRFDIDTYGIVDYWSTPAEFLKNSGDCEDYAIIKMFALIHLGVAQDKMRLVIIKDEIRNIDHAVLAVYHGSEVYILDNVSPLVLPHSKYGHYRPIVSVNLVHRWAHVPPAR